MQVLHYWLVVRPELPLQCIDGPRTEPVDVDAVSDRLGRIARDELEVSLQRGEGVDSTREEQAGAPRRKRLGGARSVRSLDRHTWIPVPVTEDSERIAGALRQKRRDRLLQPDARLPPDPRPAHSRGEG